MKLYKIRRKSDGKFSTGGASYKFNRSGKFWSIQYLYLHLAYLSKFRTMFCERYADCEVVEYSVEETHSIDNVGQRKLDEYLTTLSVPVDDS